MSVRRAERAQRLLNKIKNLDMPKIRVFSCKKIFTTDTAINHRNSRYLTDLPVRDVDEQVRVIMHTKAPGKVMVLRVFGSDGQKCPRIFIATSKCLNATAYQELLCMHVFPWL